MGSFTEASLLLVVSRAPDFVFYPRFSSRFSGRPLVTLERPLLRRAATRLRPRFVDRSAVRGIAVGAGGQLLVGSTMCKEMGILPELGCRLGSVGSAPCGNGGVANCSNSKELQREFRNLGIPGTAGYGSCHNKAPRRHG